MAGFADKMQHWAPLVAMVLIVAAAGTAGLIAILLPLLRRHVSAHPNARSSHKAPTPQGGGIAVVVMAIVTIALAVAVTSAFGADLRLLWVCSAALILAVVGLADDIATMGVALRLIFQILVAAVVIAALPGDLRIAPQIPWVAERLVLLIGTLWFVNAVNFMDGIDWITVAEVVPVTAGLALLGAFGALPAQGALVALALCGAMIGFAPFNRPVARLFLGDAGSLPIGLLLSWLLILLAGNGHAAAALLLPLYYLADATITLLRRLAKGEAIMSAHRRHYYQVALDGGMTVQQIVAHVFVVNLVLVGLALATVKSPSSGIQILAVLTGCMIVMTVLFKFAKAAADRVR
jgi:UDP-N-acetylmuramyl pentapeptide phosphotransferase/UDP-N-acetylglucosamine-1-phosphate transferase